MKKRKIVKKKNEQSGKAMEMTKRIRCRENKKKKKPKRNGKSRRFGCVVLETLTAFATATHCTNSNVTTLVAQLKKKKEKNKKILIFSATS